ncbi:MAG: bifunctional diguanylate cyclase/phosphodiesterase [Candidatus Dormibacteraeota bacterium]|nr:bifunctional diguanylate cyclase/phosphodiesterase [Candidatus Dormibacteraeota bacterium]
MPADRPIRRVVPALGTILLLSVSAWEFARSALPTGILAAEAGILVSVVVLFLLTLPLRLADRVAPSTLVLAQGLFAVVLTTVSLGLAAPWLRDPVLLLIADYMAVITSVNPAAPGWIHVTVGTSGAAGFALAWWRAGLIVGKGPDTLLAGLGLMIGAALLIYANWSLLDRHSQSQSRRLRAVADTARRLGLARDWREVSEATLQGLHEAYPLITWGGIVVLDPPTGKLVSLPMVLGPAGVQPSSGDPLRIGIGEGVSGTVFATGKALLLRTTNEIRQLYAGSTTADRATTFSRWGGGQRARSFIAAPLRAPGGETLGVIVLNSVERERLWNGDDLTTVQGIADEAAVAVERARLFEEQARHASTDPLTRVGNRRAFEEGLRKRRGSRCAVLAIDVDNLKELNDEYGHEAGDLLLAEVARALREHVRAGDLLARIGGDEFVAIVSETVDDDAAAIAKRMRLSLHGVALPYGRARISVGVATGNVGADLHALWLVADEALSRAKRGGRDRVVVATAASSPLLQTSDAGVILDAALSGEQRLGAFFQPIARLNNGTLIGYEALARFPDARDPGLGVEDVFSAAQRRGTMRDLDWACRRTALDAVRGSFPLLPLFLNVSVVMLLDPLHPVDHMLLLARWAHRSPEAIVLEITEREQIPDKRRLAYVMSSYREHGFRFALDDVGKGNSTLELLAVAVPEFVKIAGSITRATAERGPRAVVLATTAFAESSNATVIAEGIENEATATRLAGLGVTAGQGFWLGRPSSHSMPQSARVLTA